MLQSCIIVVNGSLFSRMTNIIVGILSQISMSLSILFLHIILKVGVGWMF